MHLIEQLRELAEQGEATPDDLLKIVTAVSRIKASDTDDRVKKAELRIEKVEREAAAREAELQSAFAAQAAEYQTRIAELSARVAELAAAGKSAGLSEEAIQKIEERIGLL